MEGIRGDPRAQEPIVSGTREPMPALSAADIVRLLDLKPHPEGGNFRQTFQDTRRTDDRAVSTAIYFLLARGERSHWHRVDATEIWHYYAGAALVLELATAAGAVERLTLGPDLAAGERPQAAVPAHTWQAAQSTGEWTLVGCTVAPGFEFAGFELAPADWAPGM
jgi:predicted cupin superfamily sugar epimerase